MTASVLGRVARQRRELIDRLLSSSTALSEETGRRHSPPPHKIVSALREGPLSNSKRSGGFDVLLPSQNRDPERLNWARKRTYREGAESALSRLQLCLASDRARTQAEVGDLN